MEWQPIETVPQGVAVDLWCRSLDNLGYGRRATCVCLIGDEWFGQNAPNHSFIGEYASHWMPLPAPPESKND